MTHLNANKQKTLHWDLYCALNLGLKKKMLNNGKTLTNQLGEGSVELK